MEYMRMLFTAIAVVHSLLEEIDPAFYVCQRFDLLGDREQTAKVAEFISPNDVIQQLLEDAMVHQADTYKPTVGALPIEGSEKVVARLQKKLDVLEAGYC